MNSSPTTKLRHSALITGLLASVIGISACQQQQEPDTSLENDIASEQAVPMSADPAEPNDVTVNVDDATLNDVQDDTVANVGTEVTQLNYRCTPELSVAATYQTAANSVVIDTDMGTLTLNKTNEGSNPEVYNADTAVDGSEGFTEWRVAHKDRATGVMRTSSDAKADIMTYECNQAS